jgi:hypothetical protein
MDKNARGSHISRRAAIRGGRALLITSAIGLATTAYGADKADPKLVQYMAQPNKGAKCADCVNFEAPSSCKAVAGTISPNGWCLLFAHK